MVKNRVALNKLNASMSLIEEAALKPKSKATNWKMAQKPRSKVVVKKSAETIYSDAMFDCLNMAIAECPEAVIKKVLSTLIKRKVGLNETLMYSIKKPTEGIIGMCLKYMKYDTENGDWAKYLRTISKKHKYSKEFTAKIYKAIDFIETDGGEGGIYGDDYAY